jgi:hypothetical protein
MEAGSGGGDHISGYIGGNVSGQVAIGKDIAQTQTVLTAAETTELAQAFADLRSQVAAQAPPEQRQAALERVDELEQAVHKEKPDLTTMEYVRKWFGDHLPGMAGAVAGLVVHPVVGKLVEAAGDAVVAEFRRRFGG